MNPAIRPVDRSKAFLSELLLIRGIYKGPDGLPLYRYQMTQPEFEKLCHILQTNKTDFNHPLRGCSWAACFCLFVSEKYRRDYDGGDGGWSWAGFERQLGLSFSPQQRKDLVIKGLKEYWQRPIRNRERGMDLLGSLFANGGLPWKLVQSDTHGFGRAVRGGIKHYYKATAQSRSTSDLMSDYVQYLPASFKSLETRQLLAGIVEQLMFLVEHHPLAGNADPAAYLDAQEPKWKEQFPIPLGEENGRTLINEWLKDADQRRSEKTVAEAQALEFSSQHRLVGELDDWVIVSELNLPRQYSFEVDVNAINSTRLELGYFEGSALVAAGGAIYAALKDNRLNFRFSKTKINITRKNIDQPLTLKILDGGRVVHSLAFEHGAFEFLDCPLVFEQLDNTWSLVANASCSIVSDCAKLRVPADFIWQEGSATVLHREKCGARWLDVRSDITVRGCHEIYSVMLSAGPSRPCQMVGKLANFNALPQTLYFGLPEFRVSEEYSESARPFREYSNGRLLGSDKRSLIGSNRYSIKDASEKTILRRRFGVLPADFQLSMIPASTYAPAKILVKTELELNLSVGCSNVKTYVTRPESGVYSVTLEPSIAEIPTYLSLYITGQHNDEPIELRLKYPKEGVQLFADGREVLTCADLPIKSLLGASLLLTQAKKNPQIFTIQLELMGAGAAHPKLSYRVPVGSLPESIGLFAYADEIAAMLAAVPDQDGYIRLTVDAGSPLFSLNIRRYNGRVVQEVGGFSVKPIMELAALDSPQIAGMLLSDPKQKPLILEERCSQGVGTGIFDARTEMNLKGPWLLYPEQGSGYQFRPYLYAHTLSKPLVDKQNIKSLHQAAELFHPIFAPSLIDHQILRMSTDLSHSGWEYFDDLILKFAHLPLSTFECWKSLANNSRALALIVFRLEINEGFCNRIRDELAVIWESIPLINWVDVFCVYQSYLNDVVGLPPALAQSVIEDRKRVLPIVVPGFEYLGGFLEDGDASKLVKAPVEIVLPAWYQQLRQQFEDESTWPDVVGLGGRLRRWVAEQPNLPAEVKSLSHIPETNAVAYLPIFMAFVSAGRAELSELSVPIPLAKFAVRIVSDFDLERWYRPTHSMMLAYLLSENGMGS